MKQKNQRRARSQSRSCTLAIFPKLIRGNSLSTTTSRGTLNFDSAAPQLTRIPRGTQLAAALADSPAYARLNWFTDGVLRYDQLGEQLVVTDIRLGMTGFHPFRFNFAELENGQWQVHESIARLPAERGDFSRLHVLWSRIWQPEVQVPLLAWADELRKAPAAASR